MKNYLFYDIETTGLDKTFDQILHFAAIRTDLNLNELERHELKIKLNPDVIPSPLAMITHRMTLAEIAAGISEFDAIKQIHQWLNTPGTVSVGYNTLGFDDEFLRFSFFRNLLPPYTHQYANQCGRMDLYPMAVMYFLFKNPLLQWPKKNEKPSFKLEELNASNHFVTGRSHHAMVDVEVTVELAKRFFAEKEMWEYLTGYFNKQIDLERMREFQKAEGLMIDTFFGAEKNYQCPVVFLGNHHHYKNQLLWLRLDSEKLSDTTEESIHETTLSISKKAGEPGFILPFKDRFLTHFQQPRMSLLENNKKWLQQNPELFSKIVNHHAEYTYPVNDQTDVDASLYLHGFWTFEEENFCRLFHKVDAKKKAELVSTIQNPRLQELSLRIVGRHFQEQFSAREAERFAEYMRRINPKDETSALINFKGEKRLTPVVALKEINRLREERKDFDAVQLELLIELEDYLATHF